MRPRTSARTQAHVRPHAGARPIAHARAQAQHTAPHASAHIHTDPRERARYTHTHWPVLVLLPKPEPGWPAGRQHGKHLVQQGPASNHPPLTPPTGPGAGTAGSVLCAAGVYDRPVLDRVLPVRRAQAGGVDGAGAHERAATNWSSCARPRDVYLPAATPTPPTESRHGPQHSPSYPPYRFDFESDCTCSGP